MSDVYDLETGQFIINVKVDGAGNLRVESTNEAGPLTLSPPFRVGIPVTLIVRKENDSTTDGE